MRALNARHNGKQMAVSTKYPKRDTPVGKLIDAYLRKEVNIEPHASHLLFVANRWEEDAMVQKRLADGWHVIADRYSFSGLAYGVARGLEKGWCVAPEVGLTKPNLVIYLALDQEEAAYRANFGDERFEVPGIQAAADLNFKNMAINSPVLWRIIDASGTPAEVHERVLAAVIAIEEASQS
jgi:dTMP kinase